MKYKIEIDKRALQTLSRLPAKLKRQVSSKIERLAENPSPPNSKKLHGDDDIWRIRVGDYRIAYTVRQRQILILVLYIGDRKDFYKDISRLKFSI